MTNETAQTAHHLELVNGIFECECGTPFHGTRTALAHLNVANLEAVRQRDEGIELLRSVEEVWEDLTGRCDEDCDCVVHAIRAFLSNFPEEDAE